MVIIIGMLKDGFSPPIYFGLQPQYRLIFHKYETIYNGGNIRNANILHLFGRDVLSLMGILVTVFCPCCTSPPPLPKYSNYECQVNGILVVGTNYFSLFNLWSTNYDANNNGESYQREGQKTISNQLKPNRVNLNTKPCHRGVTM